jgi:hypothetical protein
MAAEFPQLVPRDEQEILLLMLAETRGDRGFHADEGAVVLRWAEETRRQAILLELLLEGKVSIDVVDGEVAWKATALGRVAIGRNKERT